MQRKAHGNRDERVASEVFGCIPHGRGAYRESDSFALWAVHHGVTVSMTTVSISSDPFIPVLTLLFPSGGIIGSSAFVEELTRRERVAFPRERKSSPQEVCVGGLKLFALRHLKAFRK